MPFHRAECRHSPTWSCLFYSQHLHTSLLFYVDKLSTLCKNRWRKHRSGVSGHSPACFNVICFFCRIIGRYLLKKSQHVDLAFKYTLGIAYEYWEQASVGFYTNDLWSEPGHCCHYLKNFQNASLSSKVGFWVRHWYRAVDTYFVWLSNIMLAKRSQQVYSGLVEE